MLQNIRRRVAARLAGEESGFTLIELLVVMLILGILAAIALPAFFNQKEKAGDAKAKENLHSLQVTMETCATELNGQYGKTKKAKAARRKKLSEIEPTIPASGGGFTVKPEEKSVHADRGRHERELLDREDLDRHQLHLHRKRQGRLPVPTANGVASPDRPVVWGNGM